MWRSLNFIILTLTAILTFSPASAEKLGLGKEASDEEIAAWDIDVRPDGQGLPQGHGTVKEGEKLYIEKCASCHGEFGEGIDRWPVLAGGRGTLASSRPEKTVGSYWPYLSTAYDYIRRAMPFGAAQSLTADETYAILAYILNLNDIVTDDFDLSDKNFTTIKMPNENGFIPDPRPDTPTASEQRQQTPCMTDCKDEVKIIGRARVLDVTPQQQKKQKP